MPSSGLPHALEGSLHEAPSDALFWIAAGLTLTLGLLLQRAPAESNRWKFVLQRITHWEDTPSRLWILNFLLVGVMSLLGLIILGLIIATIFFTQHVERNNSKWLLSRKR